MAEQIHLPLTKAPNKLEYEWKIESQKLYSREIDTKRWVLCGVHMTEQWMVDEYIFGLCGHQEVIPQ